MSNDRHSPPEKELRLALVCYGGVSLAVYMHGVTKELWKLLKASEGRKSGRPAPDSGTEQVWRQLLDELGEQIDLSVVCDIMAGASAGGINVILLARAIVEGLDMEPLRDLWLEKADVEHMLDPAARAGNAFRGRLAQFYKEPVAWLAARQSDALASVDSPEVRTEIAFKLAHFVRSRWFKPPFSGPGFTTMLDDALHAMEQGERGPPLVPPTLSADLFVTATDYFGARTELPIHSPPIVTEREHRRMFAFSSPATQRQTKGGFGPARLPLGERPALLLAARATASFPGAFPPASIGEIDHRLSETGYRWPGRADFVGTHLASDRAPEDIALIDGSVLHNAPFKPAIDAIRNRPARREVDRRFVYVDPKPDMPGIGDSFDKAEPGFFSAIYRSMADIPREQPIRDSLEAINIMSARVRRLAAIIDGMTPDVDAAIERAVGGWLFLLSPTPERLARARSRIQSLAAREAGFAYAAYAHLKIRTVIEEAAGLAGASSEAEHAAFMAAAVARGAFDLSHSDENAPYVRLLKGLDIGFRVRRLRFLVRHVGGEIGGPIDRQERETLETLKSALHAALAPVQALRSPSAPEFAAGLQEARRNMADGNADAALTSLIRALDLSGADLGPDALLSAAAADAHLSKPVRHRLLRAWLGFPFYDIALLPLMQEGIADSFEELKIDRISPDDAVMLRAGGVRACLKGWQLNAFAAFFSRAYRENDYLWGRLHGMERLLHILLSAAGPAAQSVDQDRFARELALAILADERPALTRIEPLFDELEAILAQSAG